MAAGQSQCKRVHLEGLQLAMVTTKSRSMNGVQEKDTENKRAVDRATRGIYRKIPTTSRRGYALNAPKGSSVAYDRPFPFFELPQEIRDQVYANLVVRQSPNIPPVVDATTILRNQKKRSTAQKTRERHNLQRLLSGKRQICARTAKYEPALHVDFLQASRRMYIEGMDSMYSSNWFAISLSKLPSTSFEVPYGWTPSQVKRLQVEVQIKDAIRMNKYVDWKLFFSAFQSLRFLRIVITLHPRYFEWAHPELCDWRTTHYIHKAFFRELLAAIPGAVDIRIAPSMDGTKLQGNDTIDKSFLRDMYAELGSRTDSAGRPLAASRVVEYGQA